MSNRTLFIMISIVIVLMGVLVLSNISHVFQMQESERFIGYNEIRGMEVIHRGKPYTLNFAQQTSISRYLNESTNFDEQKQILDSKKKYPIEKIVIFKFNGLEPIEITPVDFYEDNLIFSAPLWHDQGYLIENSGGNLRKILSLTYDQ